MQQNIWRHMLPLYLAFIIAFPLAMAWVECRPLQGPTICLFRQVTHFDCPSCGLTRAFRAMGRLDVRGAIGYNPLGPALFVATCLGWGYAVAFVLSRGCLQLPRWWLRWRLTLLWIALTIYFTVGIGRIMYEVHHPPPPPRPIRAITLLRLW
jgi:hypothetical protein